MGDALNADGSVLASGWFGASYVKLDKHHMEHMRQRQQQQVRSQAQQPQPQPHEDEPRPHAPAGSQPQQVQPSHRTQPQPTADDIRCVVMVQSLIRGYLARTHFAKRHAEATRAATVIQSAIHGFLARRELRERRQARSEATHAATVIQAGFRGLKARKISTQLRAEVLEAQQKECAHRIVQVSCSPMRPTVVHSVAFACYSRVFAMAVATTPTF